MTDLPLEPAADDELLSAYLLGDLDDAAAEAFEARLGEEPELAAQLDALAAALVAFGGADEVATPDGYEARLDERLHAARAGAAVVSLDGARERRARSKSWWTAIGTAAAVVAVGGVMATGVLRGIGGGSGGADIAAEDAATTMESATDMALEESADGGAATLEGPAAARAGDDAASGGAAADADAEFAPPPAPLLYDDQAVVRGEAALRERYAAVPEADALLGTPVEDAQSVAASFTTAVQRAEPFAGGGAPADCLETVTTAAQQPLIPVRVETLRYRGRAALSYVLVTAAPDSQALDRVEVWVVDARTCATLVFQQL